MNTPTTELDGFEQMLRERMSRLADLAPAAVPLPSDVRVTTGTVAEPRRGRRVAGIGATIALIAGGVGLSTFAFQGAAEPGGAESPEAAVREFADALAAEDLLGMIDVTVPEEVTALRAAFEEAVNEAKRIGLLDDAFALDGVAGLDMTVDGLALTTSPIATDLATVTSTDGSVGAIFDATAFPLGRLISDPAVVQFDSGSSSLDLAANPMTLVTLRRGDGWYVSMGMSIAEAIRRAADAPAPVSMGIIAEGSASPEAAAGAFYRRIAQLDLASASALVAPGEGDVFRRYASLWLPQSEQALTDARANGLSINLTGLQFERIVDTDGRVTLRPTEFVIDGTTPASWGAQSSTGMTMNTDWPTLIDSSDGSGVWILDPGVVPPTNVSELGEPLSYESDAVQQAWNDGLYNSTWAQPDGTIQQFDDVNPAPADPQAFRVERRDGCTTASGSPFSDIVASGPGSERIDDNVVRTCADGGSLGVGGAVFLLAGGGSLNNLPSLSLVEDGGEWFVSPIGTVTAQVLEAMRSLPDDVNIIDVPIVPFYAGGIGRAQLDQTFTYTTDLPAQCQALAESDGAGGMRTIADPAWADVKACAEALGYSAGYSGSEVSTGSGTDVAPAVETASASTLPASVDTGPAELVPASTSPATP